MNDMSKNEKVLKDFVAYCEANPELRFWQALRNWSGYPFIMAGDPGTILTDTFYFEGKKD